MPMNRVQFQAGLSMPAFLKQFGSEAQCEFELEQARWPQGFICPCCGETGHSVFKVGSHKTFQCKACRRQTSLTAGTLFQSTRLAADDLVSGDLPHQPSQDRVVRIGFEAPTRGQLSHGMDAPAQVDDCHVRA